MSRGRKDGPAADEGKLAAREEREAKRAARAEESARRKKQAVLKRRLTRGAIVVGLLLVVAAFFIPRPGSYTPGGTGEFIQGVQFYNNPTGHTLDPVTYPQTPPAGGEHNPTWLNCGTYTEPVPNVYAVHSLEHGAVWVTYDPGLSAGALDTLRDQVPSTYAILSPYVGLPAPIVLSAWNAQLWVESADDPRIAQFFEEYWRSQNVPEPGALCSGGIDGPGRS